MSSVQLFLKNLIMSTINTFNHLDHHLLKNDVSERCICARFAFHLQNEISRTIDYSNYFVDVEYNRGANGNDYEPKRLDDNKKSITVDLIVHRRVYNEKPHYIGDRMVIGYSNLICIEMKKIYNLRNIKSDRDRLKIMTNGNGPFGYTMGFMIIIDKNVLRISDSYYNGQDFQSID